MKPEHVPHDIFEAFVRAFIAAKPGEYVIDGDRVAAALAAVAPLIAKAERKACAELADVGGSMAQSPGAKRTASSIAAAIRARQEPTP